MIYMIINFITIIRIFENKIIHFVLSIYNIDFYNDFR